MEGKREAEKSGTREGGRRKRDRGKVGDKKERKKWKRNNNKKKILRFSLFKIQSKEKIIKTNHNKMPSTRRDGNKQNEMADGKREKNENVVTNQPPNACTYTQKNYRNTHTQK